MTTNMASLEPMTESERRDMLRLIEQRKNDLAEKRKLLESLSKQEFKKLDTTIPAVPEPSTLLKDAMNAISAAQAAAAEKPVLAPTEAEAVQLVGKEGASTAVAHSGIRYSHALKKMIGPLSKRSGAVDVIIVPKVVDRFEKSCQCDPIQPIDFVPKPSVVFHPSASSSNATQGGGAKVSAEEIKKKQIPIVADVSPPKISFEKVADVEMPVEVQAPLSEEEKSRLIYSSGFESFFQKASRTVERALGEAQLFDVFADYSQLRSEGEHGNSAGERLRLLETYVDDRWSSNRAVLDIRTHPKFNELFLVSYTRKVDGSIYDPDGCTLVWNISMPQRAEYVFFCQSQVCTAIFDAYRPNNVIGGTFTGSVVLWDTRARTRPVQRTPLSAKSHHHPVYSMQLVGTQHAHNLVTVDLDGRLCLWSLSMLVQPTETIELKKSGKDVCCMAINFPEGETNSLIGGADDGSLFQAQIHGSKAGIVESYIGHSAPVTSVHWHPNEERGGTVMDDGLDYSDLLLSSSIDWSVKLWSPKTHNTPLHTFQTSDDYCLDTEWHPQHPAIFASVQADGELDIWDMSKDIEAPCVTESVGNSALSRLKWSNDGCRLITGDSVGQISIWGVSNEISQARQEDRLRFATTIEGLKAGEQTQNSGNL